MFACLPNDSKNKAANFQNKLMNRKARLLPPGRRDYAGMRRNFSSNLHIFTRRFGGENFLSIAFSSLPKIKLGLPFLFISIALYSNFYS